MYAEFIRKHFPKMFENSANLCGKLLLQDGNPSQNSKIAKEKKFTLLALKHLTFRLEVQTLTQSKPFSILQKHSYMQKHSNGT